MEKRALSLEDFLPYRLNRLAEAISHDFSRTYRGKFGLTRPEWRLLATLGQYGTMTATAIGQHSSMHKTKVSRAVTALERRRWLVRTTSDADRRVEHLALTKIGNEAYLELVPAAREFEDRLLASMSDGDSKAVLAALEALERVLNPDKSTSGENDF